MPDEERAALLLVGPRQRLERRLVRVLEAVAGCLRRQRIVVALELARHEAANHLAVPLEAADYVDGFLELLLLRIPTPLGLHGEHLHGLVVAVPADAQHTSAREVELVCERVLVADATRVLELELRAVDRDPRERLRVGEPGKNEARDQQPARVHDRSPVE